MRVRRSLTIAAAAAVLFGLVWYWRNDARTRNPVAARAEPSVPPSRQAKPSTVAPGSQDDASPRSIEQAGRQGDEVDRLIGSVDWKAFGGAVLAYTQEQERARRQHRRPNYDPRTIETLAQSNLQMQKLSTLLGIEELRETRYHERVWPSFARGWMQAVGVTLTLAQDAQLGEAAVAFARSRAEEGKTVQDASRLEKLAWEADSGRRWDETVSKLLTPEQFADYAQPAGSDPFWGRQASRHELPLGGVEESADGVEAFWQSALGLDESLRPVLKGAATEYVREVDRQIAGFRARYPGEAPREEELRLRISLLRLQAGAEKGLAERLGLPLEQRRVLSDGSGTVLDWRVK